MDNSEPLSLFNAIALHLGRPALDHATPPQLLIRETRSLLAAVQSAHNELVDQMLVPNPEPLDQRNQPLNNPPRGEGSVNAISDSPSSCARSHTAVSHSPTPELLQLALEDPSDTASQLAHAELGLLRPMLQEQAIPSAEDHRQEQASLHDLLTGSGNDLDSFEKAALEEIDVLGRMLAEQQDVARPRPGRA